MTDTSKNAGLIRMALMGTAFIGLTVILIVFQPGSPRHAQTTLDTEANTSVTRVADPLTVAPTDTKPVVATPVVTPVPAPAPAPPAPQITSTQSDAGQPANMRDMTFSAISNLKSVTTGEAPAPGQPGSLLHSVVQRSIANKTATPASTPTPAPTITQVEQVRTPTPRVPSTGSYFVRPGDTLLSIAREVYGDTAMSGELFRYNTNIITSPDSLKPGMVLKLPTQ